MIMKDDTLLHMVYNIQTVLTHTQCNYVCKLCILMLSIMRVLCYVHYIVIVVCKYLYNFAT